MTLFAAVLVGFTISRVAAIATSATLVNCAACHRVAWPNAAWECNVNCNFAPSGVLTYGKQKEVFLNESVCMLTFSALLLLQIKIWSKRCQYIKLKRSGSTETTEFFDNSSYSDRLWQNPVALTFNGRYPLNVNTISILPEFAEKRRITENKSMYIRWN